jgi:hypothetical protein
MGSNTIVKKTIGIYLLVAHLCIKMLLTCVKHVMYVKDLNSCGEVERDH